MRLRAFILYASLLPAPAMAANTTTVTTPQGAGHGSLVSGNLTRATGANTLADSGLPSVPQGNGSKIQLSTGTATNGHVVAYDANGNAVDSGVATANIATLSGANTFATLNTFSNIQFSGALNSPSGQLINAQFGDCLKLGGGNCPTAYNAHGVYAAFSIGTIAGSGVSPNGPLIRASAVHNALSTDCNSNPLDGDCVAPIFSFVYGLSSDNAQEVAISGKAECQQTIAANYGCIGIGGEGRVSGSGIGKGIGLAVGGRRETSTGGIQGAQITANNDVAAPCGVHYDGSGPCNGIWLTGQSPGGAWDVGTGLHIAGPFLEGITINGSLDAGDGSCCGTIAIDDQSAAPIGLEEGGTHATASIDVLSGAGPLVMNGNNISSAGAVSGAGATFQTLNVTQAAATVTQGISYGGTTAAATNCEVSAAGCVIIKVGSTTRYIPYY
jgi:hypothetical protein